MTSNKPHPQLFFEDFAVGQVYPGQERTLGEEAFSMFSAITGDVHPIHYDVEYASRTRFRKRIAHGFLVMGTSALGAVALSEQLFDSMIVFLEQDGKFLRPVLIGDRIRTEFEVEAVEPKPAKGMGLVRFIVRLYGNDDQLAMLGHHSYLIKTRHGKKNVEKDL